jgi:branched-chain amino acid transport system permease protein
MMTLAISFGGFAEPDFWITVFVVAGIYSIFTLGLQLNVGFTGISNFGQAGFMAVGAYTMAILIVSYGWAPWLALPTAVLVAIVAGALVGAVSVRLRGDYLAMATLAFAEIVQSIGQNSGSFTGGTVGLFGFGGAWTSISNWMLERLSSVGLGSYTDLPLFIVTWAAFGTLVLVLSLSQRTPWGRVLRAVREDDDAAEALGKNVYLCRIQSLSIAAGIGAIAGLLLALSISVVYPQGFSADFTFIGFAILVLGGLGSFVGVALGSILLWTVLEGATFMQLPLSADRVAAVQMLIVGLVLIVAMVARPQGLLGRHVEMVLRG